MSLQEFETVYVRRKFVSKSPVAGQNRSRMPEYRIWCGMIARCSNPKTHAYRRYGGRGIDVCARWREDFANFYGDMGPRPTNKHSVDRIDNDGDYEPGNCRWATPREQYLNRSDRENIWTPGDYETLRKMYQGYYSVEEIAAALNRSEATIRLRIHFEKLHRRAFITRLAKKNPDLRYLLQTGNSDAFLKAVTGRKEERVARAAEEQERAIQAIAARVDDILRTSESRNSKMRLMREAGANLSEIARHFSITRERVRQIAANGFPEDREHPSGDRRKVSKTKPEALKRKVDRLCRAWNVASREARVAFLSAAASHVFSEITLESVLSNRAETEATA